MERSDCLINVKSLQIKIGAKKFGALNWRELRILIFCVGTQ